MGLNSVKDIIEHLTEDYNSEIVSLIAQRIHEKHHFHQDIFEVVRLLQASVDKLNAPGKARDEVLKEMQGQIDLLVKAANESTKSLQKSLAESDQLRQNLFSSQLADLNKREKALAEGEAEMRKGFPKLRQEAKDHFAAAENNLMELIHTLDSRLADLTKVRDDYTRELSKDAMERLSMIAAEIETKAKELREQRLAEIQQEIDALRQEAAEDRQIAREELEAAEKAREENEWEFEKNTRLNDEYEERKRRLDEEVEARLSAKSAAKDTELKVLREQLGQYSQMREELAQAKGVLASIEASFGKSSEQLAADPEEIVKELRSAREKARTLSEELSKRPTSDYWQYKELYEQLRNREGELTARERNLWEMESAKVRCEKATQALLQERKAHESTVEALRCELEAVSSALQRYHQDAQALKRNEHECRAMLEDKKKCPVQPPAKKDEERCKEMEAVVAQGEIAWLDKLDQEFRNVGFTFNKRILYSFHTALKNGELSPLTVLAGVSGTGKSELPHLYAKMGGLNYCMVSVLPNWDSPESLLGFYNSLDNRFEAQPLAHFLARCINVEDGFQNQVNIVLLDEMNLAHVELYFAEFLSLLERRRGISSTQAADAPKLKLKLGSGIPDYEIPVSRNVLWTGTMNQDETTKALSDKVLDRSSCIYFPRPVALYDRQNIKPIVDSGYRLPLKTWSKWKCLKIEPAIQTELAQFKAILEEINSAMGAVGRAVGHRVWQSIAYYMANYPTVCNHQGTIQALKAELRKAFEDQLVQKVMPKLRGIETRGRGKTECLDKIRAIIAKEVPSLDKDFNNAMQFGQGQFLWLSAEYLQSDSDN